MKIKSSLFLLLAALLAPWAANAQDNTIVLNDYFMDIAIQPGQTYNFYDSGGAENNYGHGEEYTLTLTCNGYITINFSQFETRPSSNCLEGGLADYMLIYDGGASEDNLLMRGQTGCPSSLVTGTDYVAMSGTMTIEWKSSFSGSYQGWQATIIGVCGPVVVNSNSVYTETSTAIPATLIMPHPLTITPTIRCPNAGNSSTVQTMPTNILPCIQRRFSPQIMLSAATACCSIRAE